MPDTPRERMLASYADLGEAMVHQNVLEAEGIPCRVADLAQIPAHMFGIAGALGRSVGIWVLEDDADRAASLLASLGTAEGAVDEEALAAEALAAGAAAGGERDEQILPERTSPGGARETGSGRIGGVLLAAIAIVVALVASRGCS